MKKLILLLALMSALPLAAQSPEPTESLTIPARKETKNTIYFGVALFNKEVDSERMAAPLEFEYQRKVDHGVSFGFNFIFPSQRLGEGYTGGCIVWEEYNRFYFTGKIWYDVKIVPEIFHLRIGAGPGVTFNKSNYKYSDMPKARFHLMTEVQWIVTLGRKVDLKFSPLFATPSRFYVSPPAKKNYDDSVGVAFDLGHFSVGVRF